MRNIMLPISVAIAGALVLPACSQQTEDAAEKTMTAAAADAEANAEVVREKVERAAAEAADVVDRTTAKVDRTDLPVESETQRESANKAVPE